MGTDLLGRGLLVVIFNPRNTKFGFLYYNMVCIMFRKVMENILGFYYHGTHLVGYWSPKRAERGRAGGL
jgi:hypothetical protein